MNINFPNGVWPVMLTPFTMNNKVDYNALEQLVYWYFEQGCEGLFAVCQSSEMFYLSLEERKNIAKFVKKISGNKPVIASGHISEDMNEQIRELKEMEDSGVDAIILISNRLAQQDESDDIMISNLDKVLHSLSNTMPLGFYECPYPYKRILSDEVIRFCVKTERFHFIKDTSCDINNMKNKFDIIKDTKMKLYNANTATLLESLELGSAGYSGVMANFHPELYVWLCNNFNKFPQEAKLLSNVLTMCSFIENSNYPVNAKYALQRRNLPFELISRRLDCNKLTTTQKSEVEQLLDLTHYIRNTYAKDIK